MLPAVQPEFHHVHKEVNTSMAHKLRCINPNKLLLLLREKKHSIPKIRFANIEREESITCYCLVFVFLNFEMSIDSIHKIIKR